MEPHGDGMVWDWFAIGNRWHNTLAPIDKVKSFTQEVQELYPQLKGSYSINSVENSKDRAIIQELWQAHGLRDKNPYYSAYGFDVEESEDDYNVVPLSECLETVKSWVKDLEDTANKAWNRMIEEHNKEIDRGAGFGMSAYYAKAYYNAKNGNFCFDSNVFNISDHEAEVMPDKSEINAYWAVIVDMHN
jgi:hypothetical protein